MDSYSLSKSLREVQLSPLAILSKVSLSHIPLICLLSLLETANSNVPSVPYLYRYLSSQVLTSLTSMTLHSCYVAETPPQVAVAGVCFAPTMLIFYTECSLRTSII